MRAVRRSVGGDDDLQELGRVIELEEVLDAARDDVFLVVGCDDDGDTGHDVLAADGLRRDPRRDGGGGRIPDVGPRERREAAPEDLPHHATISRSSSR